MSQIVKHLRGTVAPTEGITNFTEGVIAIEYDKGNEGLYIKNDQQEIVKIPTSGQVQAYVDSAVEIANKGGVGSITSPDNEIIVERESNLSSAVSISHATHSSVSPTVVGNATGISFVLPVSNAYGHITGSTTESVNLTGIKVNNAVNADTSVALTGNITSGQVTGLSTVLAGKANTVHTHGSSAITDFSTAVASVKVNNAVNADTAEALTGSITTDQVTGLNTALAGKANTVHTQDISTINGLTTALNNKANSDVLGNLSLDFNQATSVITLKSGNTQIGNSIDLPLEAILKSASVVDNSLVLVFNTTQTGASSAQTVSVDLSQFIDAYTAGNFVNITDNVVSVKTGTTSATVAVGNHTHTSTAITDFSTAVAAVKVNNAVNADSATSLTGNIKTSQVTGLDTALAGKANSVHTHVSSAITDLSTTVAGIKVNNAINADTAESLSGNITSGQVTGLNTVLAGKANSVHTHTASDITNFNAAVATVKVNSAVNADSASTVAWNGISGKPTTFTPSAHNQSSETITSMTNYLKAELSSSIAPTDSLNTAISKIEYKVDYIDCGTYS